MERCVTIIFEFVGISSVNNGRQNAVFKQPANLRRETIVGTRADARNSVQQRAVSPKFGIDGNCVGNISHTIHQSHGVEENTGEREREREIYRR